MEESVIHISKSFWGNKVLFLYLHSKSPCILFSEFLHRRGSLLKKTAGFRARGRDFLSDFLHLRHK